MENTDYCTLSTEMNNFKHIVWFLKALNVINNHAETDLRFCDFFQASSLQFLCQHNFDFNKVLLEALKKTLLFLSIHSLAMCMQLKFQAPCKDIIILYI